MSAKMKRRTFISLLGGAAAAWPLAARAQQTDAMRRVGVLMGFDDNDPEGTLWFSNFMRAFQELGWIDGRNVMFAGMPQTLTRSKSSRRNW
jgi:putative tryptophan/tyrosine transport system substrate-binding protein